MPSFGHGGHLANQSSSSGFAPIAPEPKPEDRPHFFAGAQHKHESKYAEGVGRKQLKPPKELKDEGDKLLAAGTMLERALQHYTDAIANMEALEAKGQKSEGLPFEKKYAVHHNRAMCLLELRKFPDAVEDAEKVIAAKPKWVNGYLRKGGALFAMARFEDARQTYQAGMDATGDRYDENLKEGKQACVDIIMRTLSEGLHPLDGKPGHPRGTAVAVKGLQAKPELNGAEGEVVADPLRGGSSRPTARIRVRLNDGQGRFVIVVESLSP